jgi:hypothetical protein
MDRRAALEERLDKANALALFTLADVFTVYTDALRASTFLEYTQTQPNFSVEKIRKELISNLAERLEPQIERLWVLERESGRTINSALGH